MANAEVLKLIKSNCRLCLINKENMISIFPKINDTKNKSLSSQIYECTSIKVNESDLTTKICQVCIKHLKSILSFRKTCLITDDYLKSIDEKKQECSVEYLETNTNEFNSDESIIEMDNDLDDNLTQTEVLPANSKVLNSDNLNKVTSIKITKVPDSTVLNKVTNINSTKVQNLDYLKKFPNIKIVKVQNLNNLNKLSNINTTNVPNLTDGKKFVNIKITRVPNSTDLCKLTNIEITKVPHSTDFNNITKKNDSVINNKITECLDNVISPKNIEIINTVKYKELREREYDKRKEQRREKRERIKSRIERIREQALQADIEFDLALDHRGFGLCHICGQVSTILSDHVLAHTSDIFPEICDVCGRKFKYKRTLVRHRANHNTPEIPCNICNKNFVTKNHLRGHVRRVHGERRYKCNICQKRFKSNSDMKTHTRYHTGEKPFGCDQCPKFFAHSYLLKYHVRKEHNG